MLEGLSRVNWKEIRCASGTGEALPPLIRQVTSADRQVARKAVGDLRERINPHGAVCEASVPAIPFLIELLTVEAVQVKGSILDVLRGFIPAVYWVVEDVSEWPEPNRSAAQAVVAGLPVYLELLSHSEAQVRRNAFTLLCRPAWHRSDKIRPITAALHRCFERETESDSKWMMTIPFGEYLAAYKHLLPREQVRTLGGMFEALWRSEEHKGMSFAASVSLARVLGEEAPNDIVEGLIEALVHPPVNPRTGMPERIAPGIDAGVDTEAQMALWHLGLQRSISAFARVLQQVSDPTRARRLAAALLRWVVAGDRIGFVAERRVRKRRGRVAYRYPTGIARFTVESLTGIERQALDVVLNADQVWKERHNLLEMVGLPASRKQARRFLSGSSGIRARIVFRLTFWAASLIFEAKKPAVPPQRFPFRPGKRPPFCPRAIGDGCRESEISSSKIKKSFNTEGAVVR